MISHFLKNDIYDSNIVEITGRRILGCEQSYITALYSLTEKRFHLKLLLGFSAELIRTGVNDIQVK